MQLLKREVEKRGGVSAVAEALDVSTQAVYHWLNGKREPSDKLLNYLGLRKIEKLVRA